MSTTLDLDVSTSEALSKICPLTTPCDDSHIFRGFSNVIRASQLFYFSVSGLISSCTGLDSRRFSFSVTTHHSRASTSICSTKTRLGFTVSTTGISSIGSEVKFDGVICCIFNEANLIVDASVIFDPTAIIRQCAGFYKALWSLATHIQHTFNEPKFVGRYDFRLALKRKSVFSYRN